jgi:hypothetical protein
MNFYKIAKHLTRNLKLKNFFFANVLQKLPPKFLTGFNIKPAKNKNSAKEIAAQFPWRNSIV